MLNLAAAKAGWGGKLAPGRARHGSARVIRIHRGGSGQGVSLQDGKPWVHRVVCAIDCGTVVNSNIVAQQLEGAVISGLTAALYSKVNIQAGVVHQSNFPSYPIVKLAEAPQVETWIVPRQRPPGGGVGEAGRAAAGAVCGQYTVHAHGQTRTDTATGGVVESAPPCVEGGSTQ